MKKNTLFLIFTFIINSFFSVSAQNLIINEILSSNSNSITDEDGSHQDWIEIYNNGSTPINLLGHGLSDNAQEIFKWTFPSVTLNPGQYLIVWASDKNRAVAGSPLHTNFKISADGEAIILTNPSGVNLQTFPAIALQDDVSYGRSPNASATFAYFTTPTPNAANSSTPYSEQLNPPVFSQDSGFMTSAFNLTLSSAQSGTTILYTTDGSEPDPNNLSGTTYSYKISYPEEPGQPFGALLQNNFKTFQYSAPIPIIDKSTLPNKLANISTTWDFSPNYFPNGPIYKANVIKAKVIKSGSISSPTVTKTYFVSPEGAAIYTLPVVSISFNENVFYDYYTGISVAGVSFDNWRTANPTEEVNENLGNFNWSGLQYERPVNLSYFVNGQEVVNQKVGLRINGDYSRIYPSKSMKIYARSDFGNDNIAYPFFSDEPYDNYERVVFKNGGSDFSNTMFRDALCNELTKNLNMETEASQQVIAFINGEYWGILAVRETYDNNYFKQVYGIPSDQIDLLENSGNVKEGSNTDYLNFINYINSNDLADPGNYNYIKTRMDTDSFIDYFVSNIYLNNDDWPANNIVYWRKRTNGYQAGAPYGHDGRWRWAFHDVTSTFGDQDFNTLDYATTTDSNILPLWSTLILRKLLQNQTFKNEFISRFADLMNTNFLSTRINSQIDLMAAVLAPEMPDQYFRWKGPVDNGDWQYHINKQKQFANARPAFQRTHIRTKFNIESNINVTLNVDNVQHGYIKINTIEIKGGTPGIPSTPSSWTGIYFHNIPVKLKAIPLEGYQFSHWTGASNSTDSEITITPTADFSVTAHFIPSDDEDEEVVYFWVMDDTLPNNTPLTSINSSYETGADAVLQYQSCLAGYPFTASNPLWRKASMERRNNPTSLNYIAAANNNITYANSNMRGIQVKQPFQSGGLENTLIFNVPSSGYKNLKFSFAVVNEGAASGIIVDYATNSGTPTWVTTGLSNSSATLTGSYQVLEFNFSSILTVNNNPNFKIRIRFTGPNMTVDNGDRVTFNNIALKGQPYIFSISYPTPNTFTANQAITNINPTVTGDTPTNYSVGPSLPTGLTLDTTSGIISGTPTVVSPTTTYTVTATNSGGSTTASVVITVNDMAPNNLSYNSPNIFTKDVPITNLTPTVSGGAVVTYSINPNLPDGLSLDTATGIISGTPTAVSPLTSYTVTATNSGGSTTTVIEIKVEETLPNSNFDPKNISVYPNPFSGTINIKGISDKIPYEIFSIDGKLVQKGIYDSVPIQVSELPTGMFLLKLEVDGAQIVKKIIKQY